MNRRVSQPINSYLSVLDRVIAEAAAAEEARIESDIPQQEVSRLVEHCLLEPHGPFAPPTSSPTILSP